MGCGETRNSGRTLALLSPWTPVYLFLSLSFFSRSFSRLSLSLPFSLSLSFFLCLSTVSLRNGERTEGNWQRLAGSHRWKFPRLAISVQSASRPLPAGRIHARIFRVHPRRGRNSIQTNLTLARLIKLRAVSFATGLFTHFHPCRRRTNFPGVYRFVFCRGHRVLARAR